MHTILLNSGMAVPSGEKGYCPPSMMLACLLAAVSSPIWRMPACVQEHPLASARASCWLWVRLYSASLMD